MLDINKTTTAKKQFLSISNLAVEKRVPCFQEQEVREEMMQLTWLSAGKCRLRNSFDHEITMSAGEMLMAKQASPHIQYLSEDASGFSVVFNEAFLFSGEEAFGIRDHAILNRLYMEKESIDLNADFSEEMTATTRLMIREGTSTFSYRDILLHRYLRILLLQAGRNLEEAPLPELHGRHYQITRQYLALVEKDFCQYKQVSDYASRMNMTSNHLNTIIKKVTGQAAKFHIRDRVMKEAKRQAAVSGSCMKTIAYELGFNDLSHFSRYFKLNCGMNFTAYRKDEFQVMAL